MTESNGRPATEVTEYKTQSTSWSTGNVSDIVLPRSDGSAGQESRKVLKAEVIENNKDNPGACLKIKLAYQKAHGKDIPDGQKWEGLTRIPLRSVKQGESIEIDLDTNQTLRLKGELDKLYLVAAEGVPLGNSTKVVISGDQAEIHKAIGQLDLSGYDPADVVAALVKVPDVLQNAAALDRHQRRCSALDEFQAHMDANDWTEGDWEQFFRANDWIFGHGLAYRFMTEVEGQASLGGMLVDGKGAQRTDYLMASEAGIRFTTIVDIKKPSTPLLYTKAKYRNKIWMMSGDLNGGVSQVQAYCRTWVIDGSKQENNKDALEGQRIYTVQPRGILLIGNTNQLDEGDDQDKRDKRNSFELYRQNLGNPEVLTFDELFERAKLLVHHDAPQQVPV